MFGALDVEVVDVASVDVTGVDVEVVDIEVVDIKVVERPRRGISGRNALSNQTYRQGCPME